MDPVRKLIARAIAERPDLTLKSASLRIGKNETYLQQFLNRNVPRELGERPRELLAELLDIPEEQLGGPKAKSRGTSNIPTIDEIDIKGGAGGGGGISFDTRTRGENGVSIAADAIRDQWGIPDYYLRQQLRGSRTAAKIIEIYGDSMYDPANPGAPGSLFPGDRVVVDLSDTRPSPPGPFALWDGVGIVVKMVEVVPRSEPARLRLLSRNPVYVPYEATEDEARIIGRVRVRISAL